MQKVIRSGGAMIAGLLASLAWGVDMAGSKTVGNVASHQHRISTKAKAKAKKNQDGKLLKRGKAPEASTNCLARRKGIPGVARGYLDNRGKASGFNVNGFRGDGLR